jgi:serine/threonine protein kinase
LKDSWLGRRIGPYELREEIGEGGMGVVYRAVRADDQYRKEVAIKLLKNGLDSSSTLARFKVERQILASLEHPNIARLFDGGATADGLPYFVMELVNGLPIDEYCDLHSLAVAERLKLFRSVCWAVQYAHDRSVIHRDLKPGNVLVTKDGVPKLLDFGIAKIVDPASFPGTAIEPTQTMMRVLTPEYASPEQMRGEATGSASDVYSLGVILYILLTGHRPYNLKSRSPHDIAEAVCDIVPEKPSSVVKRVAEVSNFDGTNQRLAQERAGGEGETDVDKLRRQLTGDLDNKHRLEGAPQGAEPTLRIGRRVFGRYPAALGKPAGTCPARYSELPPGKVCKAKPANGKCRGFGGAGSVDRDWFNRVAGPCRNSSTACDAATDGSSVFSRGTGF